MHYRTTNPFMHILLVLGGVAVLGAALIFGAVLLAILLGIGVILAVVLWVRFWLMRGLSRTRAGTTTPPPEQGRKRQHTVIEGEFREVSRTREEERRRDDSRD